MVWLIGALFIFCKAYHVNNKDESFYYLRKMLGVGHDTHFNKQLHMMSDRNTSCFTREIARPVHITGNSPYHKFHHHYHDASGVPNIQ